MKRTKDRNEILQAIPDQSIRQLLGDLHGQAERQTAKLVFQFAGQLPRLVFGKALPWDKLAPRLDDKFIALDRSQGVFCYLLARAIGARRIVEFGTSYGISTIYLAAAVRDNGGGTVIATERVPAKAARARQHFQEAGLSDYIELREGDALETLRQVDGPVDFFLNDGFPPYALPILKLLTPVLRSGAVVVADNVGAFSADHTDYMSHVRDPHNGFLSAMLDLNEGTEFSLRIGGPNQSSALQRL